MQADGPVQGVATYRLWENNRPRFDVSVPATLPTVAHTSAATRSTAFALGNPYSSVPVDVFAEATSNSGQSYRQPITLPGSGHRAMSLGEAIPNLPTDFRGILELYSANNNEFAVLVLREADGIYSSLPSGHTSRPIAHFAVLQDIFARLKQAWAAVEFPNPETIETDVRFENEFNASGSANGVQFDVALSELFADSESEIAFVVAHEFGHVYQFRTGRFDTWHPNRELDADVLGMLLSLIAGYDPYAAAGALAKLHMVIGAAGLQQQAGQHNEYLLEILTGEGTLHGSFNERIDHLHKTIQRLCSLDDFRDYCDSYRRVFHPSFPPGLLLEGRDERRSTTTQEGFAALVPATITATILGLAAQIEREFISARTKEALERRKAAGLPVGRPKGRATKLMLDDRRAQIVDYLNKGVSKRSVAKILGCSPTTLYSWIRRRRISGR